LNVPAPRLHIARRAARRLTTEQVEKVRRTPWVPGSGAALARELQVSAALISLIRHGYIYKQAVRPRESYYARVTAGGERYWLGTFCSREAAQAAIDNFELVNRWPRGAVVRAKNSYRARLSLGQYDTPHAAERANERAIAALRTAGLFPALGDEPVTEISRAPSGNGTR
jgi:hypothetical protein